MSEYNAASRRHIREAEKASKIRETEHQTVVRSIMQHQGGRSWMFSLLETTHIFASSFTNNALSTAFREGERNIGLRLLGDIMKTSADEYILMMREANERERTAEQRRSTNGDGRTETELDSPTPDERDEGRSEVEYPTDGA